MKQTCCAKRGDQPAASFFPPREMACFARYLQKGGLMHHQCTCKDHECGLYRISLDSRQGPCASLPGRAPTYSPGRGACNYPHLSTPNQRLAGFAQIVSLCAELFEG